MKFSVRDLFLVTVIVALGLGWWVDHRRQAAENEAIKAWRDRAGALEAIIASDGSKIGWETDVLIVRHPDGSGAIRFIGGDVPSPLPTSSQSPAPNPPRP